MEDHSPWFRHNRLPAPNRESPIVRRSTEEALRRRNLFHQPVDQPIITIEHRCRAQDLDACAILDRGRGNGRTDGVLQGCHAKAVAGSYEPDTTG
jgi:hypothetical protein